MVEIKNTLCFAYPNGSAKPTMGEVANFVKSLDASLVDMDTTYRIAEEKAIFIKFKSETSMNYALMHNPVQMTFHYAKGDAVEVRMTVAGGHVQYVRVYDLPPEVPNNELSLVLAKYGKVKRVVREKFPVELGLNMYTGVRGVYMDVDKEIPSSLNFLSMKGNIFYSGNKDKCFLCKEEGHRMSSCPKRKGKKQQKLSDVEKKHEEKPDDQDVEHGEGSSSGSSTYAGVASGGASLDNNSKATEEIIEVLDEEVVEMDVATLETGKESGNETQQPLVFKNNNDRYYYYKFGIVNYTEETEKEDKIEAERQALAKQKRLDELRELRAKEKAAAQTKSPPRKKKNI